MAIDECGWHQVGARPSCWSSNFAGIQGPVDLRYRRKIVVIDNRITYCDRAIG